MIRLHLPTSLTPNSTLTLLPEQSHYLVNVMRQKEGAELLVFNAGDGEWAARLLLAHKKHAEIAIISQTRKPHTEPDIWLCFAPVKNVAIHLIAQKATELGVSRLQPVITDYTVVPKINEEKLYANAIEAAEQCERLSVPEVTAPLKLARLLESWDHTRTLIFCDESGEAEHAGKLFPLLPKAKPYAVIIGPEGGFSEAERALLRKQPFTRPVTLGPRILRADTAAMTALACLQMCVGDWEEKPRFVSETTPHP